MYGVYLRCWTDFMSEFPPPTHTHTKPYWCMSADSYVSSRACWFQCFRFPCVGALRKPGVFSSGCRRRQSTLPAHCLCLSNHSQPRRDFWQVVTVRDQTCPCVSWFRWRKFWASVVNCDSMNNKNSTVMCVVCIVSVVGKILRSQCKLFVFESNFSMNSKIPHFRT